MKSITFNPESVRHRIMVTLANQNLTSAELEEHLYDIVDTEVQKVSAEPCEVETMLAWVIAHNGTIEMMDDNTLSVCCEINGHGWPDASVSAEGGRSIGLDDFRTLVIKLKGMSPLA